MEQFKTFRWEKFDFDKKEVHVSCPQCYSLSRFPIDAVVTTLQCAGMACSFRAPVACDEQARRSYLEWKAARQMPAPPPEEPKKDSPAIERMKWTVPWASSSLKIDQRALEQERQRIDAYLKAAAANGELKFELDRDWKAADWEARQNALSERADPGFLDFPALDPAKLGYSSGYAAGKSQAAVGERDMYGNEVKPTDVKINKGVSIDWSKWAGHDDGYVYAYACECPACRATLPPMAKRISNVNREAVERLQSAVGRRMHHDLAVPGAAGADAARLITELIGDAQVVLVTSDFLDDLIKEDDE